MSTTKNEKFFCVDCKQRKLVNHNGGTGYGSRNNGDLVCYDCCGIEDICLLESKGCLVMYLIEGERKVTNWCGTLSIPIRRIQYSNHNFAGRNGRRDVWFVFKGNRYHGVNIGDSDICRVKRTK